MWKRTTDLLNGGQEKEFDLVRHLARGPWDVVGVAKIVEAVGVVMIVRKVN